MAVLTPHTHTHTPCFLTHCHGTFSGLEPWIFVLTLQVVKAWNLLQERILQRWASPPPTSWDPPGPRLQTVPSRAGDQRLNVQQKGSPPFRKAHVVTTTHQSQEAPGALVTWTKAVCARRLIQQVFNGRLFCLKQRDDDECWRREVDLLRLPWRWPGAGAVCSGDFGEPRWMWILTRSNWRF